MADLLLIHGSGHGAWCWDRLKPEIEARGHSPRAIDLPGRSDGRDPAGVTLDDMAGAVVDALGERTVLVGHSLGGLSVTLAADRAPDRVAALVYLCAWVPVAGRSIHDLRAQGLTTLLRKGQLVGEGSFSYDPETARKAFYNDLDDIAAGAAVERLVPEPLAPVRTPVMLAGAPHPARHYVICTGDCAIDPGYQETAAADFPPDRVHRLPTGHSPFLSAPARLAELLDSIAKAHT